MSYQWCQFHQWSLGLTFLHFPSLIFSPSITVHNSIIEVNRHVLAPFLAKCYHVRKKHNHTSTLLTYFLNKYLVIVEDKCLNVTPRVRNLYETPPKSIYYEDTLISRSYPSLVNGWYIYPKLPKKITYDIHYLCELYTFGNPLILLWRERRVNFFLIKI